MKRFAYLVALVASFTLFTGTTAAVAGTHPDNRATHGPGAVTLERQSGVVRPDDRATHGSGAVTLEQQAGVVRPDDHATHGPGAVAGWRSNDVVRPDDRATHGQGAIVIEQVTGPAQVPAIGPAGSGAVRVDGFDWLDAAIGAAAAVGLGLIAAGGAAFVLRRAHTPAYS